MNVTVFIENTHEHKKIKLAPGSTITTLLTTLNYNPVEAVAAKNGAITSETATLKEGDDITIYSVISGG